MRIDIVLLKFNNFFIDLEPSLKDKVLRWCLQSYFDLINRKDIKLPDFEIIHKVIDSAILWFDLYDKYEVF